ncbi:hypothetical protein D3C86_1700920 [compost metagenome]
MAPAFTPHVARDQAVRQSERKKQGQGGQRAKKQQQSNPKQFHGMHCHKNQLTTLASGRPLQRAS